MGKGMAVLVGLLGVTAIFVVWLIGAAVSFNNTSLRMENGLKAQYEQNQNNYDNYWKKLKEVAQVPDMYSADLKKVWDGVMSGRYGSEGSKALFQWIQEQNPQIDSSMYRKIQDVSEAGRNSFEADQKMLVDKRREYQNYYMVFPNSLFAGFFGVPRIDLAQYAIVTSEETDEAFKTKKSAPIKLR